MAESIAVVNGQPGRNFAAQFSRALVFKTCLREIAILDSREFRREDLRPTDEVYLREDGYQYLLEVICGLHSPLVGETEVMGQFKNFAVRAAEGPGGACTAPWIQRLIGDAKRVRANHLTGLGGRSYGQLAERHLAACDTIAILGAGHLVEETVPSFADHPVEVFCRRPEAVRGTFADRSNVTVHGISDNVELSSPTRSLGLLIAAPLTADEIRSWIEKTGASFKTIVDLRGESSTDPLFVEGTHVVHFKDILTDLESNRRFAQQRVDRAREEIRARAIEFWQRYDIRPFGWEDLCA